MVDKKEAKKSKKNNQEPEEPEEKKKTKLHGWQRNNNRRQACKQY